MPGSAARQFRYPCHAALTCSNSVLLVATSNEQSQRHMPHSHSFGMAVFTVPRLMNGLHARSCDRRPRSAVGAACPPLLVPLPAACATGTAMPTYAAFVNSSCTATSFTLPLMQLETSVMHVIRR